MKKSLVLAVFCVIFSYFVLSIGAVYCRDPDSFNFYYNDKIFNYQLTNNTKTSSQFDQAYLLNKYGRFSSTADRKKLLSHMLNVGIEEEVALEYLFPNITKSINKITKNISLPVRDARIRIISNSEKVFEIIPEQTGISLDRDKLIKDIIDSYIFDKTNDISIPIKTTEPTITKEKLKKHTNLRADFSTDISHSSEDRKHNIKNALHSLNKIVLYPNEIFSFNKSVGRRTSENGYREAKIIVNNEFVEGIGGGVCQVSSTLYNSALLAGLEILEANKHSKQVQYVKYGFDAMVNFGSSDLKFRNNTNEKLTIITNYTSNKIRIRIFGEALNSTRYKLVSEISNVVSPIEEVYFDDKGEYLDKVTYVDEYFYLKKASTGMDIKSYREKYIDNQLISRELLRNDKYKVQNAQKIYGTKARDIMASD